MARAVFPGSRAVMLHYYDLSSKNRINTSPMRRRAGKNQKSLAGALVRRAGIC